MMISSFNIKTIHFYPGCKAGLNTKTAIVSLTYSADLSNWQVIEQSFILHCNSFFADKLYFIDKQIAWIDNFLLNTTVNSKLAHWVAALTTAVQQYVGAPVWKAQVLSYDSNSMQIALSWDKKTLYKESLIYALRMLIQWSIPETTKIDHLVLSKDIEQWALIQMNSCIKPNSFRFALSAYQRNIPVSHFLNLIKLGQECNALSLNSSITSNTRNLGVSIVTSQ